MAEEATNNDTSQPQGDPDGAATGNGSSDQTSMDPRATAAFKAVLKQLEESRTELTRLRNDERDKAAAREREELEKRGQYETITKQLRSEIDSIKAQHAREITHRDLKTELIKAGATNDRFITGCVTGYNPDDGEISEYVSGIISDEANAAFFNRPESTGQPAPKHGAPGGQTQQKSLDDRLADGDIGAKNELLKKMMGLGS